MLYTTTTVLVRIFSNPLANVFQKRLTQKGKCPLVVNFFTYFILSLFCLFFIFKINWFDFSQDFWLYSMSGGFLGALGNAFLVKALEGGELSVLGPINSYKAIVGMIIAMLFLHEFPTLIGLMGMGFILVGSYFIFDTLKEKFSLKLLARKDIQYRLLALIFTAIEAVCIKKVIIESSFWVSFIMWCIFGAIFAFMFLLAFSSQKFVSPKKSDLWKIIGLVIAMGVMQLSTSYVFKHMQVGYALSLFQLSTLVSVFFGYKFFKESNIKKKLLGAVVMILGSVLIILY